MRPQKSRDAEQRMSQVQLNMAQQQEDELRKRERAEEAWQQRSDEQAERARARFEREARLRKIKLQELEIEQRLDQLRIVQKEVRRPLKADKLSSYLNCCLCLL